jgi:hypothetical protein
VLDASNQLGAPLTHADRHSDQDRFEEMIRTASSDAAAVELKWTSRHAAAEPGLDSSGEPMLRVRADGEVATVGIARGNILSDPDSYEFAAGLVKARVREELKPAVARKTARADVQNDLALLQQLLEPPSRTSARNAAAGAEAAIISSQTAP